MLISSTILRKINVYALTLIDIVIRIFICFIFPIYIYMLDDLTKMMLKESYPNRIYIIYT